MTPAKSGITVLASRILAVLALVTGTLAVLAPSSGALPGPPCRVTKLRTTQVYDGTGSNLQSAIDAAQRGTRLLVRGLCVGNFTIGKNLRLFGRSTAAYPTPTLDANHVGRVLFVSAGSVLLKNLTITNGSAFPNEDGDATGGGIYNAGTLTLISSSSVRGNSARSGGGISNNGGTLSLSDSSSVRGNTAIEGGGILNYDHATLSLSDSSSVRGNTTTPGRGGGISNYASKVTLNDSSSVNYNRAVNVVSDTGGGGIFTYGGSLTLNGSSSVRGNMSDFDGGGVYNLRGGTLTLNGSSSVTGNTATVSGGGIVIGEVGTLTLKGSSSVTGNTATVSGGGIVNGGPSTPATHGQARSAPTPRTTRPHRP